MIARSTAALSSARTIASSTATSTVRSIPVAPASRPTPRAPPSSRRPPIGTSGRERPFWSCSATATTGYSGTTPAPMRGSASRAAPPTRVEALRADLAEVVLAACASTRRACRRARTRSRSGRRRGSRPRGTGCGRPRLRRRSRRTSSGSASAKSVVEALVGVLLARDREVAVADHVEQHHRLDPVDRRAALLRRCARNRRTGGCRGARPSSKSRPGTGLLAVEERDRDRRAGHRVRQRASQLEDVATPEAPSLAPDEARNPGNRVVMGAEDDVAVAASGDHADDVAKRPLDANVGDAGGAQLPGEHRREPAIRRGARRARAERHLRLQVGEGARGVEAVAGDRGPAVGSVPSSPPQPPSARTATTSSAITPDATAAGRWRGSDMRDTLGPCLRDTWIG